MRSAYACTLLIVVATAGTASAQFKKAADPGTIVKPRQELRTEDAVTAVAFSPDGSLVATTADRAFFIWNVASGKRVWHFAFNSNTNPNFHTLPLTAIAFSADGKRVATSANDTEVKLWDVATAKFVASTDILDSIPKSLAFSPDGKTLAAGVGPNLKLFDPSTLKPQAELSATNEALRGVAYSADGKTIAAADSAHGNVHFYDATTGKAKGQIAVPGGVAFMAYTLDGRLVATAATVGQNPKKVEIRDAATGKVKTTVVVDDEVWGLAFSPDGKTLALAFLGKTARLIDVATGRVRATFEGHTDGLISIAFSPDGKTLITGAQRKALLWDVPSE